MKAGKIDKKDAETCQWCYIWSVCVYYSVLVIGGNEMQPAQTIDLIFVVFMNIGGLIFMTWIAGEISVLIYQMNIQSSLYQNEIDTVNTAMKNA